MEISDEKADSLRNEFYTRPQFESVAKELVGIHNGKSKTSDISKYYFRDIMAKTRYYKSLFSVEEVFQSKELLGAYLESTTHNKRYYPDELSDYQKIMTALRIGMTNCAKIATNFPYKRAVEIINKYNQNNVYYDYSSGWGIRMLASMYLGIEYIGTDPNNILVDRLLELKSDYDRINNCNSKVRILCSGSEVFHRDLCGTVGVAFSSPPYYGLEDYQVGQQSYKSGMSYDNWIDSFLKPTIRNIWDYLIDDGILAINIKDYDEFTLVNDSIRCAISSGFVLQEVEKLIHTKRPHMNGDVPNEEKILIFRRR